MNCIEAASIESPTLFEGAEVSYSENFLGDWGLKTSGTRVFVGDTSYKMAHDVCGLPSKEEKKPFPDKDKVTLRNLIRDYRVAAEKGSIDRHYGVRTSNSIEHIVKIGLEEITIVVGSPEKPAIPEEVNALISFFETISLKSLPTLPLRISAN